MRVFIVAMALALVVPAAASAQTYPEPKEPGKVQTKPKGPHKTHTVCKQRNRCDFTTIQKAVDKAKAGDTIRVRNGTYREAVKISGSKKRYLRADRQPLEPGEGPAPCAREPCRTGSGSTKPTRSPSTASWRATTRPTGTSSRTSTATR